MHGLPLRDTGTIGRTMTPGSSPLTAAAYRGAMAHRIARPVQHTSSAPANCSRLVRGNAVGWLGGRYRSEEARLA